MLYEVITLADRREFEAKLIGSDPQSDIALLKIEADHLPTLKFGDSKALRAGECKSRSELDCESYKTSRWETRL